MIKRIEELKETKEFIEAEARNIKTKKRVWITQVLDALIVMEEHKDELENVTYYDNINKEEKDLDSIIKDLEQVIQSINNTSSIYNYLNNKSLKDLIQIFSDLINLVLQFRFDKHTARYEELKEQEIQVRKKEIIKQTKQDKKEFSKLVSNISNWTEEDKEQALDLARKLSTMRNFKDALQTNEKEELLYNYS